MSLSAIYSACPAIQTGIAETFGVGMAPEALPVLEFLTSAVNTRGLNQLISPGGGKKRTIKLSFFPDLPESTVVEGGAPCGPFPEIGDNTAEYVLDAPDLVSGESISAENVANYCMNNAELFRIKLAKHFDVVDKKVATEIATQIFAKKGNYSDSARAFYATGNDEGVIDAQQNLEVRTKLTSGELTGFLQSVQQAAQMTGYNPGQIVAFGGAAMQSALQRARAGCCTNSGLNIAEILAQFGFGFAYDRRIAAAFGGQNFSMITVPGAIQLLSYQLAGWKDGIPPGPGLGSGYVLFGAFTRAGVPVDVIIKDECPGKITFSVTANIQIATLPNNMFYAGEDLEGVNFINAVEVKNA